MASSAVTASRRSSGWNVIFVAGKSQSHSPFAGVFSPANCSLLTFQDVVREMSLCFEFDDSRDTSVWDNIAFETLDVDLCDESFPSFVKDLGLSIPSLDSPSLKCPNILRFRMLRHTSCQLPDNAPLDTHLLVRQPSSPACPASQSTIPSTQDGVIRYTIRQDATSINPQRASSIYITKTATIWLNVTKKDPVGPKDIDVNDMAMPADADVDLTMARKYASIFRTSCPDSADACAVSGKGASWYYNSDVGPALHAYHVVEQKQYHLYPLEDDYNDDEETMYSTHRLRELWIRTWSPANSILMLSHLHELFDARLFSVHPKTHRIRAFVPYDIITVYHGKKAALPRDIDILALQHHYDMCCIENMAAKFPYIEVTTTQEQDILQAHDTFKKEYVTYVLRRLHQRFQK